MARQKLASETVDLTVRTPRDLAERIVRFADESGATLSGAARELWERGLAAPANPEPVTRMGKDARQRAKRSAGAGDAGRPSSARTHDSHEITEARGAAGSGTSPASAPSREVEPMFKRSK